MGIACGGPAGAKLLQLWLPLKKAHQFGLDQCSVIPCREPTDADGSLLKLDRVALVVPQAEVARYIQASNAANISTVGAGRRALSETSRPAWNWVRSSQVRMHIHI